MDTGSASAAHDVTHGPIEQALVRLDDGHMMPQLGCGTWRVAEADAAALTVDAVNAGYRAIDTAAMYGNEAGVGAGLRDAGLPRDALFVTTKLDNPDHGHDATLRAFDASLARLGLDQLDLYLIHWPRERTGLFVESWKVLVRLRAEGRVRSIGVSNFQPPHLERIIDDTGVKPAVNQIELHPRFQQVELRGWMDENGIATQSWSPLGQATILSDPVIAGIAAKHRRSAAQVVIRWHLDQGIITIPKAADRRHLVENLTVGGFALDPEDMTAIAALDDPFGRIGPAPDAF